ncbi:MAG: phospholipid carrier-dependent glycosyltransferase [Victivallales bacterium]|nr:phospholipid carrier-dependent glycosyltransferase [Victivallales bacterium]
MLFEEKSRRKIWWSWLLIILLLYLLPLGIRPLVTPDETRYAEIPREMTAYHDWMVPHLGGLRYFEKPILGYWLGALSQTVCGANNFAVRLPSALATIAAALLLWAVTAKFRRRETATLTMMIFTSCALVYFVGTFAVLDAPVSLFVTGALLAFYLAYRADSRPRARLWLSLMGVSCGLAFLTKGFIAMAIPALVIGPFMFWEKRGKDLLRLPWLPLLTAGLVILPWSIAIHRGDPDFWRYFIVVEHWNRFFAHDSAQHPAPCWYFIPIIIGGAMPWTLLVPGIMTQLKRELPVDSFTRYCWCWLIFPFLFFSISSGKLGTYILPCFPAVAVLIAGGLETYFAQPDHRIFNRTSRVTAIICFIALSLLLASQLAAAWNISPAVISRLCHKKVTTVAIYGADESWKWLTTAGILAIWGYSMLRAARSIDGGRKIRWFCLGPLLVFLLAHPLCPGLVLTRKAPGAFLTRVADKIRPDDIVVADNRLFAAASWYWRRNDLLVYRKGGELQYGLNKPQARKRFLSEEAFVKLVKDPTRRRRVVLVLNSGHRPRNAPAPQNIIDDPDRKHIRFAVYNANGMQP